MSWRSSRFRHVLVRSSIGYDGLPITRSVHDNHFCSANPRFIAVVTECSGGGAFVVLPVHHTGRVEPKHPRVCGHRDRVLDVKWNPFDDHVIASCSEDCTVKVWDVPAGGVQHDLTVARKTLIGHSRRVGLIEWHPTAENLLLSSAYDYKVLLWDVSQAGAVLTAPVRVVLNPALHQRHPADALLLSANFNPDGSRLAVASRDRRVRVLDPRTGRILQVSSTTSHRASKVLYLGGLRMLLSTGCSAWNHRQLVLWDPDDLSEPLHEEDLDGSAGVLFPFYDPDTHLLYLAGKGDGNIRYYELNPQRPFIRFLTESRSLLPQKGLGVMPKRGLDVTVCEVFRFYRLVAVKDLVEPLSVLVPRKESQVFQEDLYPLTSGNQAAMTAQEWLLGVNRGPVLMSLRPGPRVLNPYPESPAAETRIHLDLETRTDLDLETRIHLDLETRTDLDLMEEVFLEEQLSYQTSKYPGGVSELSGWDPDETQTWTRTQNQTWTQTQIQDQVQVQVQNQNQNQVQIQTPSWSDCCTPHCCEPAERPPPPTESQLLLAFYRQQEEIEGLRAELHHRDQQQEEIEGLRAELRHRDQQREEIEGLRAELRHRDQQQEEIEGLRAELHHRDQQQEQIEGLRAELRHRDQQQEEIEGLRAELHQRDVRISQLELDVRSNLRASF